MSMHRVTSITLTCAWCGQPFHPWSNARSPNEGRYCSKRCRSQALMARINKLEPDAATLPVRPSADVVEPYLDALEASDALHAVTQPRPTPASRRTWRVKSTPPVAPTPTPTPPTAEEIGHAWRESGQHWERVAAWMAERSAARAKRQAERFEETGRQMAATEGRVLVLHGFGAGLFVKDGKLVVKQGQVYSDQDVQDEALPRGEHGVSTLVWITNGGAGSLSIQAMKWLAQQAITLVLLTDHGQLLGVIHPMPDSPTALDTPGRDHRMHSRPDIVLRRRQYGLDPKQQVALARLLIERKIVAQRSCLIQHPEVPDQQRGLEAADIALSWLRHTPVTPSLRMLDGVRVLEGRAARGYYSSWTGLSLKADTSARRRWPASWLTVGSRYSPLTRWHSPRHATNPAHSMLNWLYACLESQVRGALNAYGFDPAVGILHADDPNRDSLVYDVMEPLRGLLDERLLTFLQQHTFGAGDFQADSDGRVVIHPSLLRVLAELCRLPQRHVDDEARWLRTRLLDEGVQVSRPSP